MRSIIEIMNLCPVIPVLVIDRIEDAAPMARALSDGGLKVLEVTLRTEAGLPAIAAMKAAAPDAIVGAGTVNNAALLAQAAEAGAEFIVAPGLTTALADAPATSCAGWSSVSTPSSSSRPRPVAVQRRSGRWRVRFQVWPSARPGASVWPTRPPIWRCPACAASAAAGSRRRCIWRPGPGTKSAHLPPKPAGCRARAKSDPIE